MKKIMCILVSIAIMTSNMFSVFSAMYTEQPDTSSWHKWEIPKYNLRDSSATDVSFLLDAPAGKHGFIYADGEDMYFKDGTKARFWGLTMGRIAGFPNHEQTDIIVNRIAQSGYNLVRLHQLDYVGTDDSIFGKTGAVEIDDTQLNKVFYLISKLKEKGIYIYMDLLVSRPLDNLPAKYHGKTGAALFFDEELIEAQKNYAHKLLTTVNPYTGLALKDDPVMVFLQVLNERGMFNLDANSMSQYYIDEMHYLFNVFLSLKYADTNELSEAWQEEGKTGLVEGESLEDKTITFFVDGTVKLHSGTDDNTGTLFENYSTQKKADIYEFLYDTTENFYLDMKEYIIKDIGIKCMITAVGMGESVKGTCNVPATARLNAEYFDFIDDHAYMSHPNGWVMFEGTTGDMTSSLYKPELLKALTQRRVYDKPFIISEWQECNLNPYRAEMLPIMAGYACFQNYTPIHFTLSGSMPSENSAENLDDPFEIWEDPVQTAIAPMAALIYLRHEVDEAGEDIEYYNTSSKEKIINEQSDFYDYDDSFRFLKRGIIFSDLPGYSADKSNNEIYAIHKEKSDSIDTQITNQMVFSTWNENMGYIDRTEKNFNTFTINSDYTNLAVGFQPDRVYDFDDAYITYDNQFAAVGITSVTDEPLGTSDRMLITAVGRAQNTGYEADYTDFTASGVNWGKILNGGTAPVLAELISAEIILKTTDDIKVYALDNNGGRTAEVSVENTEDGKKIVLDEAFGALSYEVVRTDNTNSISARVDYTDNLFVISGLAGGTASDNVSIYVKNEKSAFSTNATTNKFGEFFIEIPVPDDSICGNYAASLVRGADVLAECEFTYIRNDAGTITLDTEFFDESGKLRISGTAFAGITPMENADVSVIVTKEKNNDVRDAYYVGQTVTDENGRYNADIRFADTEKGVYRVEVVATGYANNELVQTEAASETYNYQGEYTDIDEIPIEPGKIKLVCVGDAHAENIYNQLVKILPQEYAVREYGKTNAMVSHSKQDYQGTTEHNKSLEIVPDIVIIMIGAEDANRNWDLTDDTELFRESYNRLIESYRSINNKARIILMTPPPTDSAVSEKNKKRNELLSEVINDLVIETGKEHGCMVIDAYSVVNDEYPQKETAQSDVWIDGSMLSGKGYKLIADSLFNELEKIKLTADAIGTERLSLVLNKAVSGNVYVGAFDEDGVLVGARLLKNQSIKADISNVIDISEMNLAKAKYIKLFLWNEVISPLAEFAKVGERFVQNGRKVTISGKSLFGGNTGHAILVKDASGNIVYAEQSTTDKDGLYSYTFKMPIDCVSGEYRIYTKGLGGTLEETANYQLVQ